MGNFDNQPLKLKFRATLGGGPLGAGSIVGLLLITGGSLLFLDNLAILPFQVTDAFWPVVLMVFGAVSLFRSPSSTGKVWSSTAIIGGILLLLGNYNIIHAGWDIIWPLALIAGGVVMLICRYRWQGLPESFRNCTRMGVKSSGNGEDNRLQIDTVFSGVKRRVETTNFEGGQLNCVFGSIELDLRRATISSQDRSIEIEANAVFGGIEIRIPENWKLNLQGTAVFGNYEDKTIPPRPEPGVELATLILRGGTAFGAVVIQN